jgi:hypothetical protein
MLVVDWVGLLPSMDLTQWVVLIAAALACGTIVVVAANTADDQQAGGSCACQTETVLGDKIVADCPVRRELALAAGGCIIAVDVLMSIHRGQNAGANTSRPPSAGPRPEGVSAKP